jgi:thymidylate synthase
MEVAEQGGEFREAVGVLMELSEDERNEMLAESREKFLWDQRGREEYRYEQGLLQGREKGREEGRTEGYQAAKAEDQEHIRQLEEEIRRLRGNH